MNPRDLADATAFIAPSQLARMVGSKNRPPSWCCLPPIITLAPLDLASSTCSCALATAASSISGPTVTSLAVPGPTRSLPAAAANFSAKAS